MSERKIEIIRNCAPWIVLAAYASMQNLYWLTFIFGVIVDTIFIFLMFKEEDPRNQPVNVCYLKNTTSYIAAGNMYRVFDQPHQLETGNPALPVYLISFWAGKYNWVALWLSQTRYIEPFFKRTHQSAFSRIVLAVLGFERYTIAGHVSTEPDSVAGFFDMTTANWDPRMCEPFFVSYVTTCLYHNLAMRGTQNETTE